MSQYLRASILQSSNSSIPQSPHPPPAPIPAQNTSPTRDHEVTLLLCPPSPPPAAERYDFPKAMLGVRRRADPCGTRLNEERDDGDGTFATGAGGGGKRQRGGGGAVVSWFDIASLPLYPFHPSPHQPRLPLHPLASLPLPTPLRARAQRPCMNTRMFPFRYMAPYLACRLIPIQLI